MDILYISRSLTAH